MQELWLLVSVVTLITLNCSERTTNISGINEQVHVILVLMSYVSSAG